VGAADVTTAQAAIIAAGIALAGVIVAAIFARRLATREARREHDRWLRNERLAAYTEFLAVMDRYRVLLTDSKHGKVTMREFVTVTTGAVAPIQLLGPDLAKMMAEALHKELGAVLTDPKHPFDGYRAARKTFIQVAADSAHTTDRKWTAEVNRAKSGKRPGPLRKLRMRLRHRLHRWEYIDLA
jgi:hypothetical protein